MTIFDQMCECCCNKAMSQDISDRQIESLTQQIADLKAEQARLVMEEINMKQAQAVENAADLYKYHAGLTEVIDVEPIYTGEGTVYMSKPTASDIEGYMWKQMIEEAER